MDGLKIVVGNGGTGRVLPQADGIAGFLTQGVAVVGGLQLEKDYRLRSIEDARNLGINAAYDVANNSLIHEHLKDCFRINPNADIRLMVMPKSLTISEMVDLTEDSAQKLILAAKGEIRHLVVSFDLAVAEDYAAVVSAVTKAQELATANAENARPLFVYLEGKYFTKDTDTNLRALAAPNVSVFHGQHMGVVGKGFTNYAAMGILMGVATFANVHENHGWVNKFNVANGEVSEPAIGGVPLSTVSDGEKATITANGCAFLRDRVGVAGVYVNSSPACTLLTSDFAFSNAMHVMNKAVRALRTDISPDINRPIAVDDTSGQISAEIVAEMQSNASVGIAAMLGAGEISAFSVEINPNQNIIATGELSVKISITPVGTAQKIVANIGFVNPFN